MLSPGLGFCTRWTFTCCGSPRHTAPARWGRFRIDVHPTALNWRLSDPYDGEDVPGTDAKRPYGDFTFYQLGVALHLGLIPAQKPADHDPMTPEIVDAMTSLHGEMQPALQVFLEHFEIPDGQVFTCHDWGGWEPS